MKAEGFSCSLDVIKTQDPDPDRYSAKKMLDPDLYSMNPDPKHCCQSLDIGHKVRIKEIAQGGLNLNLPKQHYIFLLWLETFKLFLYYFSL